nr:retrotransposon protein, putative, Ty1-copia subclass [Tanacetum cinerariifolium]
MINLTTFPLSFWDYALETAIRILKMVSTNKVDKTPCDLWNGKVPNLSYLKVWGCEALVKRDTPDKLQQRSVKCIFIRYPKEMMGYYLFFPSENKIVVAREVKGFKPPQDEVTHQAPERLYSESNKWLDAMNAKMQSMKDNQVWCLVDLPPNGKTVGSKWLFKKKTNMDGNVHTYKARLVAKGFFDPNHPRKVCKLQRSIYGLKQALRSWNKRFDEEVKKFRFAQNRDEPCVYQKASESNVTFRILYVDDIIIMGNYIPSLQSVKTYLGKCFAMKDLGKATFILGINICRDKSKRLIGLSQSDYMDKILKGSRWIIPNVAVTPQVMAIQGGRIQKANKKSLNVKEKGKGKDKS